MKNLIYHLLFPPKCVLCRKVLEKDELDLCRQCRKDSPLCTVSNAHFSFVAGWTAVWYYKDTVRNSLLRYKFYNQRGYAQSYGRLLAMKIRSEGMDDFDLLTWIPVSRLRRWKRGYDQVELLAKATARELGVPCVPTLKKIHNNPPQSRVSGQAARRANVLGVYDVPDIPLVSGKRILLLDDIITTGATVSECAKILMFAGAQEVTAAAVAAAPRDSHSNESDVGE